MVTIYAYLMANICQKKMLFYVTRMHIKMDEKQNGLREKKWKLFAVLGSKPMLRFVEFTHSTRTHMAFHAFDVEKACDVCHLILYSLSLISTPLKWPNSYTHTHPFYTFARQIYVRLNIKSRMHIFFHCRKQFKPRWCIFILLLFL